MDPNPHSKGPIRFGAYEADLSAHVLRKSGVRIRLQEKPFRMLAMLLSHPGDLVTREDLQRELWPGEEYGEFDLGLNTAVKKLRQALSDSAENPAFIETVPRLGYRFIYPIAGGGAKSEIAPPQRIFTKPVIISAAVAVLIAALSLMWWIRRPSESTAPPPQFQLRQITRDTGYTAQPALSPDGKLLAYASDREGFQTDIWVQQIAGGEPIRLTTHEADDKQPSFSPDGSRIVFVSDRDGGGIYVVPTLGGQPRRIADRGVSPRYSPDGKWVSYAQAETDGRNQFLSKIRLVPSSGGTSKLLETGLAFASPPIWSPDGAWMLFAGSVEPRAYGGSVDEDWWVLPSDGGSANRLKINEAFEKMGINPRTRTVFNFLIEPLAWLEGDRILFAGQLGEGGTNLWQVLISTSDRCVLVAPQRLTSGTGESEPSASLDGLVAFVSSTTDLDIWSLPLEANRAQVTGPLERVVSGMSFDAYPSISGDGRKLAYTSDRSGNLDIWLRDLETKKDSPVTVSDSQERRGEISDDGKRIAFTRETSGGLGGTADIFIVDLRRGIEKRVIEGASSYMDWTPDETRLLFYTPPPQRWKTVDVETGEQVDLGLNHPKYPVYAPRYSPDGDWIAIQLVVDRFRDVRLFIASIRDGQPADYSQWVSITQDSMDRHPWWSLDGNTLYFLSFRDEFQCVWAQGLDPKTKRPAGPAKAVLHLHGRLRIPEVDTALFGYAMTPDRLYLPLSEARGNIWLAEPINPR